MSELEVLNFKGIIRRCVPLIKKYPNLPHWGVFSRSRGTNTPYSEACLKYSLLISLWRRGIPARVEVRILDLVSLKKFRVDLAFIHEDYVIFIECKRKLFGGGGLGTFRQALKYHDYCDFIFEVAYVEKVPLDLLPVWLSNLKESYIRLFNLPESDTKELSRDVGRVMININSGEVHEVLPARRMRGVLHMPVASGEKLKVVFLSKVKRMLRERRFTCDNEHHDTMCGIVIDYLLKHGYDVHPEHALHTTYYPFRGIYLPIGKMVRIDVLAQSRKSGELLGVEVKSHIKDWDELAKQLLGYITKGIPRLYVAVPRKLEGEVREFLKRENINAGTIAVNPWDRKVTSVRPSLS